MVTQQNIPDEDIKRDIDSILKGKYPEEGVATIGTNRNQLFVRIPKFVTKRLHLKEKEKIIFRTYQEQGEQRLEVEVVR